MKACRPYLIHILQKTVIKDELPVLKEQISKILSENQ